MPKKLTREQQKTLKEMKRKVKEFDAEIEKSIEYQRKISKELGNTDHEDKGLFDF